MSLISSCLRLLSSSYGKISVDENFVKYDGEFLLKDHYLLDDASDNLKALFADQPKTQDRFTLKFSVGIEDPVVIDPHDAESIRDKLDNVADALTRIEDGEHFHLTIRVDKAFSNDSSLTVTSVYSQDDFSKYLSNLSLQEALEKWNRFSDCNGVVFKVWDDVPSFRTNSFLFVSAYQFHESIANNNLNREAKELRKSRIDNRNRCSHFANAYLISLIPEDFYLVGSSGNDEIDKHFNILCSALSVIFLADITSVDKDALNYTLKGYKTFSSAVKPDGNTPIFLKELFTIYEWTYGAGNFVDKIGLARNVITLHCPGDEIANIEECAALSIFSAYEIYLKENVKQYIDVKNKILDFVHSQSDKSKDLVNGMFSTLKSTFWSIITFFISIFLLRVLVQKKQTQLMTEEVSYVAFALIAISFIYLIVSVIEVNRDKHRLLKRYDDIRLRYTDILKADDIERILGKSDPKASETQFIEKQRNLFVFTWVASNIVLLILVFVLRCV